MDIIVVIWFVLAVNVMQSSVHGTWVEIVEIVGLILAVSLVIKPGAKRNGVSCG